MPVSITNLIADFHGGNGKSLVGNRVSTWTDQYNGHIASQGNDTNRPENGSNYIEFGSSTGGATPSTRQTRLSIATTMSVVAPNISVYVVAEVSSQVTAGQTILDIEGYAAGFMRTLYAAGNGPGYMVAGTRTSSSKVRVPCTKCVLCVTNSAAASIVRVNDYSQPTTVALAGAGTLLGGAIGSFDATEYFTGRIYRLLIYGTSHTALEASAICSALAEEHDLSLNPHNLIIFEGDSLTAGASAVGLENYPNQTSLTSDWIGFNIATGGQKIGTAVTAGTMANTAVDQIDSLYNANGGSYTHQILCVLAGTNDISSDAISGATCFTRLIDFLSPRKTLGFETWVHTLPDRGSNDTEINDYNALIRQGHAAINRVVDKGKGSADTRLSDSTNTTFYTTDQLHLTADGYGVLAEGVEVTVATIDNNSNNQYQPITQINPSKPHNDKGRFTVNTGGIKPKSTEMTTPVVDNTVEQVRVHKDRSKKGLKNPTWKGE